MFPIIAWLLPILTNEMLTVTVMVMLVMLMMTMMVCFVVLETWCHVVAKRVEKWVQNAASEDSCIRCRNFRYKNHYFCSVKCIAIFIRSCRSLLYIYKHFVEVCSYTSFELTFPRFIKVSYIWFSLTTRTPQLSYRKLL